LGPPVGWSIRYINNSPEPFGRDYECYAKNSQFDWDSSFVGDPVGGNQSSVP